MEYLPQIITSLLQQPVGVLIIVIGALFTLTICLIILVFIVKLTGIVPTLASFLTGSVIFEYQAALAKMEAGKAQIPLQLKERARDRTREWAETVNAELLDVHLGLYRKNYKDTAPNTVDFDFEHLLDGKIWKYLVGMGMGIQEKNGLPEMTEHEFRDRQEANFDRFIRGISSIFTKRWTCQAYQVDQFQEAVMAHERWLREQMDNLHEQYRYLGLQKENEIRKLDKNINDMVEFVKKNRCMPGADGCTDKPDDAKAGKRWTRK